MWKLWGLIDFYSTSGHSQITNLYLSMFVDSSPTKAPISLHDIHGLNNIKILFQKHGIVVVQSNWSLGIGAAKTRANPQREVLAIYYRDHLGYVRDFSLASVSHEQAPLLLPKYLAVARHLSYHVQTGAWLQSHETDEQITINTQGEAVTLQSGRMHLDGSIRLLQQI